MPQTFGRFAVLVPMLTPHFGACGPGVLARQAESLQARACACTDAACHRQAWTEGRGLAADVSKAKVRSGDRERIAQAAAAARRCLVQGHLVPRATGLAKLACACRNPECRRRFATERKAFASDVAPLTLGEVERRPIAEALVAAHRCADGETWVERAEEIRQRACTCQGPGCFRLFMDDLKKFKDDAGGATVSRRRAEKIRAATEAAMRCALRQHQASRDARPEPARPPARPEPARSTAP